jgi:hypothetical protein
MAGQSIEEERTKHDSSKQGHFKSHVNFHSLRQELIVHIPTSPPRIAMLM